MGKDHRSDNGCINWNLVQFCIYTRKRREEGVGLVGFFLPFGSNRRFKVLSFKRKLPKNMELAVS